MSHLPLGVPSSISWATEMKAANNSPEAFTSSHDMRCSSARDGTRISRESSIYRDMLHEIERERERDRQYEDVFQNYKIDVDML